MSFLLFLALLAVFVAALYFIYWSNVLFYWANPIGCPPSAFKSHVADFDDKANAKLPTEKKYLIIGGGFCGLGACGALKRYGIAFDCAEKNDAIGGNWYNGVYETVHIISSRKTTEYKDFPMPSSYPDFPSAKQMHQYLESYAKHYKLENNIMFNTEVVNVEAIEALDRPSTATQKFHNWRITLRNNVTNETRTCVYKGLIVANGHHWDMRIPSYKGQDTFKGQIIHSKNYKNPSQLKGKRVLVVGGGNSACDVAAESARFADKAHISVRRGYWFMPRSFLGYPLVDLIQPWMPLWLQRIALNFAIRIVFGKYSNYGLPEPEHKVFNVHPTINSELLNYIKLGEIIPHRDIESFEGNTVRFVDGSHAEVDLVVFCTGYHTSLPMVKDYVKFEAGHPLIKGTLVPGWSNFFVFGVGQVRYGAGPMYTQGAESIAATIIAQEKLKRPVWKYVDSIAPYQKKSEGCNDILLDPHVTWKGAYLLTRIMHILPWVESVGTKLGYFKE